MAPTSPSTPLSDPGSTATAGPSFPKELLWALGEFQGDPDWGARLALLVARGWQNLPNHQLTEVEKGVLRTQFLEDTLKGLDQQRSKLLLDLDRRRLLGPLPATEPAATLKSVSDLDDQLLAAQGGVAANDPPGSLPLRAVWPRDRDNLPWGVNDGPGLAAQASASYAITGTVRLVGVYLSVTASLYSRLEQRVLDTWEGRFAPDEAADRMAEAADHLREALLGRPWSGLILTGKTPGIRVKVADRWHPLPWSSDELLPGPLTLVVSQPGKPDASRTVDLPVDGRLPLTWDEASGPVDKIVLKTEPPGVALYLDSQYIGPSPQTVDRPRATTRVRAQAPGWETAAWEIGPDTPSPSLKVLVAPHGPPAVQATKDNFYFTLALFSVSLTTTAFVGAWATEQLQLADAYYTVGNQAGVDTAYSRYELVTGGYVAGVVLTSGIFVWMMVQLGDYLAATQATLP